MIMQSLRLKAPEFDIQVNFLYDAFCRLYVDETKAFNWFLNNCSIERMINSHIKTTDMQVVEVVCLVELRRIDKKQKVVFITPNNLFLCKVAPLRTLRNDKKFFCEANHPYL